LTPKKYDILVVDDEPEVTTCLSEVISSERYACTSARSGPEAVDLLRQRPFDVVLADMLMPGMDGLELLQEARRVHPESRGILMSGRMTSGMAKSAMRHGAFDVIAKPVDVDRMRALIAEACQGSAPVADSSRTNLALREADTGSGCRLAAGEKGPADMARQCCSNMVAGLTASLQAKNSATMRHSVNTAYYAQALGRQLDLSPDDLLVLKTASLVHDIGKIGIPDAILDKPGKLTVQEYALVRRHPRIGYEILHHTGCLGPVLPAVLFHHEWWNGAGYPHGFRGEQIPLAARIIHAADAIDAMFSQRSYRRRYTLPQVVEELESGLGGQFDPRIGRVAIDWLETNPELVLTSPNREHLLAEAGY